MYTAVTSGTEWGWHCQDDRE